MLDGDSWASDLIDTAYDHDLAPDDHQDVIDLISWYLFEAKQKGVSQVIARQAIKMEIVDITPVNEPFTRVVKRTLRYLPDTSSDI